MNKYVKKGAKKLFKKATNKITKKIKRKLFIFLAPLLIMLFLVCSAADFLYFHVPKEVNAAENVEMKNYAISTVEKANVSNLLLEDGTKLNSFCDIDGKDLQSALKWSDLYAMVLLEDNTSIESFNTDKDHTLVKKRFDAIATELAPKLTYIKGNRKVTLTTTLQKKDSKGKITGTTKITTVVSDTPTYHLKFADTLYGKYSYEYVEKTETKTDSEGTWTTTYLTLVKTTLTEENKRIDEYLKNKLKLNSKADIKSERRQFIELSAGIYNNSENGNWLIDKGGLGDLSWEAIAGINISPEIMSAVMAASNKYSIPPWLILGFINRESSFNPYCVTYMDWTGGTLKNPTLEQVRNGAWGLMQVTEWESKAKLCGYSNPGGVLTNINAQVDVGCYELVMQKFKLVNINPKTIDWAGNGWIEQTWLGCQAYNGLIYYNSNPSKTKEYAFSEYLRRADGTGVFDVAEKFKAMFEINTGGQYVKKSSWPTPGYHTISSPFGLRIHPISGKQKFHNGIDIAAPMDAKIVSASAGTVIQASDKNNGYGNCVVVRTSTNDYLYAHMSSISVKEGNKVTIGQQLGTVGSTGYSTGAHLHFGISLGNFQNGNWIDPSTIISK